MNKSRRIFRVSAVVVTAISVILYFLSFSARLVPGDFEALADKVERRLEGRLDILEACVDDPSRKVPEDMVIYRYVDDSLIRWSNQFPISNDDITPRLVVQRLTDPRNPLESPLTKLDGEYSFCNLGSSWYLAKSVSEGRTRTISALEIVDSNPVYRMNPRLKIGRRYLIHPLLESEGAAVNVKGRPQFKIFFAYTSGVPLANAVLIWASLLVFLLGVQLFLRSERTIKAFFLCVAAILCAIGSMFIWGYFVRDDYPVFSPALFSDGDFLFSLGALVLVNMTITNISFSLFLIRDRISISGRSGRIVLKAAVISVIALILLFANNMMKSIVMNSSISPELYKLNELSVWTAVIYASFMGLLFSIPLLLSVAGFHGLSNRNRIIIAIFIGAYLVSMGAVQGFQKEKMRVSGWAEKLATDTDVELEPDYGIRERGYSKILGNPSSGVANIPGIYGFAMYKDDELMLFRGNYPYPTVISASFRRSILDSPTGVSVSGEKVHFTSRFPEDVTVVITRPNFGLFNQFIAFSFVALVSFILLSLFHFGKTEKKIRRNYYTSRIHMVLMTSLIITLVTMAVVSIVFVSKRNASNINTIASEKIASIQTMVQDVFGSPDLQNSIRIISTNTNSDINVYSTDGHMIFSTDPQRAALNGHLLQENAFEEVLIRKSRYFVQKEFIGKVGVFMMYAPIRSPDGATLAVVSSPYTGSETYDFERDAVMHSVAIITIFLILLMGARFFTTLIVNNMFSPLSELGMKMESAGLDTLEKLDYGRNDEISPLVSAYNRMVDELSESSRQLAQAERDKAWSGMARQVAHEIKNPLTPMKLQLQRIIRLKQKGGEDWQGKFDEMADVLLNHIDILTKTANEFSDFAKLYTEEASEINLDRVLQEEISMFDSKSGITIDYMGFKDAVVSGPKPQLTRVFINIINNAVQAVSDIPEARIQVSLRNSADPSYYDIVFEDNGPGVSDENIQKLFTPNFTTKNGGSGLGLAMSRSILEKCSASISYSKSFTLGGACFLIKYPKNQRNY